MKSQEYHKVYNDIKLQILDGHYARGQKLEPERVMCNLYRVSRITIRHALRLLEEDGLVERFQGKGTFVKNIKPAKLPITESGFAKSVKQYAPGLYRDLLKNEHISPPEEIDTALQLNGSQCLLAIRTDVLEKEIVAFDKAYIRPEYTDSITIELLKQVDFFEKWIEQEAIDIAFYHETIEAVESDKEVSSILKIQRGKATLKSTEVYFTSQNKPVIAFESYYQGSKIKLTSTVNFKGKANVRISYH